MKIFNIENGVEKVYVQLNDLIMLDDFFNNYPASIYIKMVEEDLLTVTDENRMEFVKFDLPHEIDFFRSADYIIDYKEIRDLTEDELETKKEELINRMNNIVNEYNQLTYEERKKSIQLKIEYEKLKYKIMYIEEIMKLKRGYIKMPFPIVEDIDGFEIETEDNENGYRICSSLGPNVLLLSRIDGNLLTENDFKKIPAHFVTTTISLYIMETSHGYHFNRGFKANYRLSENRKYLIIEFTRELNLKKQDSSGVKKLIKRIFNK